MGVHRGVTPEQHKKDLAKAKTNPAPKPDSSEAAELIEKLEEGIALLKKENDSLTEMNTKLKEALKKAKAKNKELAPNAKEAKTSDPATS